MNELELRKVIDRVVGVLAPEEIWLFGSRVEGRARPDSDYDLLAVMPDRTPDHVLDPVRAYEIVRGIGVPVDLVPCTRSEFENERDEPDSLVKAAVMRGRRVYVASAQD